MEEISGLHSSPKDSSGEPSSHAWERRLREAAASRKLRDGQDTQLLTLDTVKKILTATRDYHQRNYDIWHDNLSAAKADAFRECLRLLSEVE